MKGLSSAIRLLLHVNYLCLDKGAIYMFCEQVKVISLEKFMQRTNPKGILFAKILKCF